MGMPGKLQADAGFLDNGQAVGHVVEQNAGAGAVQFQRFKRGAQAHGKRGVVIGHAHDLKAVGDDLFIVQDADARAGEGGEETWASPNSSWLPVEKYMPNGGESCLNGAAKGSGATTLHRRNRRKEDHVRMQAGGKGGDAAAEAESIDVAEVKVADHECGAAAP